MEELLKNKAGIQILTDSGWSDFEGLMVMGERDTVLVILEDGSELQCTPDHKIYTEGMIAVEAQHLTQQHRVVTGDSVSRVEAVETSTSDRVYDIHKVKNNRRFIADNMLVSNCEFVIYEETLVDSLRLIEMQGIDPMRHMGQVRWYQNPHPDRTYVVSLDPSAGTGGDPAAIQVVELPTLKQVAEWQHNKTPIEGQIKNVMNILQYLQEIGSKNLYWSVENNTIGEAALVVIRDTGEENFPGEFLNEPKKHNGQRGRRGFHTGHKSKVEASLIMKRWIENDKLKIHSKPLVSELKNFVAKGNSYAAKPGEHDDLVMSMMLAVRMIQVIATYEDDVYDAVNNSVDMDIADYGDDWDMPYPTMV